MSNEKLCPYCYKNITESYVGIEQDLKCPHCSNIVPKVYLKYPARHVVSIRIKEGLKVFEEELSQYLNNSMIEKKYSRVECYEEYPDVKFVLFEYLKEEYSLKRRTEVIVFHSVQWNNQKVISEINLEYASGIVVNLDITDMRALYFNLGIIRSEQDFAKWNPKEMSCFIRELGEYLNNKKMQHKTAILLGNMQCLHNLPGFNDLNNKKSKLLNIDMDWTSGYNDRMWIKEAQGTICGFLREIGEDRLVEDVASLPMSGFFLYPDSAHRMTSNVFWMLSVLLWLCEKID